MMESTAVPRARARHGVLTQPFSVLPAGVMVLTVVNAVLLMVGAGLTAPRYSGPLYRVQGTLRTSQCSEQLTNSPVVITDHDSRVIAETETSGGYETGGDCAVDFVAKVPKAPAYTLQIGDMEGPTYSFEELEELGFEMSLSKD